MEFSVKIIWFSGKWWTKYSGKRPQPPPPPPPTPERNSLHIRLCSWLAIHWQEISSSTTSDSYHSKVCLSGFLHFHENHGADLFRPEGLLLALILDLDPGSFSFLYDGKRPELHVGLDTGIVEAAPDKTLGIFIETKRMIAHYRSNSMIVLLASEYAE